MSKQRVINFKNWISENKIIVIEFLVLVLLCVFHALEAGHYVNFYPNNGTFQNYNPVRRFLNGQIPYRDFNDYLGMGHLYLGTVATRIFGGNYKGSLIAFSFLTFFSLAAISSVLGRVITSSWKLSLGVTNILLVCILVKSHYFAEGINFSSVLIDALDSALTPGNSARFVRGFILVFEILLLLFSFHLYDKKKDVLSNKYGAIFSTLTPGIFAGLAFVWSNDYGISCWLCLMIMIFYISLIRSKKFLLAIRNTGVALVASFISIFIGIEILSFGHFRSWAYSTFGTGGYQGWYYNSLNKSFYFTDVDFSFVMIVQALLTIGYLFLLYRKNGSKEAVIRYGIPAFANMASFCAVNEYKLLSGDDAREVALSVLFLTIMFEIIGFIVSRVNNLTLKKVIFVATELMCIVWVGIMAKDETRFYFADEKEGVYIDSMGGNMTWLYPDMLWAHDFLQGEDFFSTYASGQEVLEGKFHPSDTDYIIHVLGDQKREDYLNSFVNGNFRYAVTLNKEFTHWEFWLERANWFFYRELYQNWHPVFANSYETYWERNATVDENTFYSNIEVNAERISDSVIKIWIDTDQSINGNADIFIDYSVEKNSDKKSLLQFQRFLQVQNNWEIEADDDFFESNYLRSSSAEYIPMKIVDGYGELILSGAPEETTLLNLNNVSCERIFTVDTVYRWMEEN